VFLQTEALNKISLKYIASKFARALLRVKKNHDIFLTGVDFLYLLFHSMLVVPVLLGYLVIPRILFFITDLSVSVCYHNIIAI